MRRFLNGVELVGVVAETLTRGKLTVRIERVGRPEVKNLMLAPKQFDPVNRDLEIRDLYNMEDAFHLADGYQGAYRARLDANLAFWDGLDGKTDWATDGNGSHPLTELVLADYLVVDPGRAVRGRAGSGRWSGGARRPGTRRRADEQALQRQRHGHDLHATDDAGTGPMIRDGVDLAPTRPAGAASRTSRPADPVLPEPLEQHH